MKCWKCFQLSVKFTDKPKMSDRFHRNEIDSHDLFAFVQCTRENPTKSRSFYCLFELLWLRGAQHTPKINMHAWVFCPKNGHFLHILLICQWHVGHVILCDPLDLLTKGERFVWCKETRKKQTAPEKMGPSCPSQRNIKICIFHHRGHLLHLPL